MFLPDAAGSSMVTPSISQNFLATCFRSVVFKEYWLVDTMSDGSFKLSTETYFRLFCQAARQLSGDDLALLLKAKEKEKEEKEKEEQQEGTALEGAEAPAEAAAQDFDKLGVFDLILVRPGKKRQLTDRRRLSIRVTYRQSRS